MDKDSKDKDNNMSGSSSLPVQRSPLSQVHKKSKNSPDPSPIAKEAIKWIRHTFGEHATKRITIPTEMQRNMFSKLSALDTTVHDLIVSNLQLKFQLEESRRSAEICVGAAAAQFEAELRLRVAAHEQTLEVVVVAPARVSPFYTRDINKTYLRCLNYYSLYS